MAAIVVASCSFATVRGPDPLPKPPGDCTQHSSAPTLDALGAGVGVVGMALGALAVADASRCNTLHPPGYNNESCGAEGRRDGSGGGSRYQEKDAPVAQWLVDAIDPQPRQVTRRRNR